MSKGSTQRPTDTKKFAEGFDRAFTTAFRVYHFRGPQVAEFDKKEDAQAYIDKQDSPSEYYWER